MSGEPTLGAENIPLPQWLSLPLGAPPTRSCELEEAVAEGLDRLLGGAGETRITVLGASEWSNGLAELETVEVVIPRWRVPELPTTRNVRALHAARPSVRVDHGANGLVLRANRLTVVAQDGKVQGLRCRSAHIHAERPVAECSSAPAASDLRLVSAAAVVATAVFDPADVRDYLIRLTSLVTDGQLRFLPGGRFVADGRVRLGLIPIRGRVEGRLAVRNETDLVIEGATATVGALGVPPRVVAEAVRRANPLLTFRPFVEAGLPLVLEQPDTDAGVLRLSARVEPNGAMAPVPR